MGHDIQVYFVRALPEGLIKIGKARCSVVRMQGLVTMSPVPLELMAIMLCKNDGALEYELHERFAAYRSHGEWFWPAPELLEFIKANARPPRPRQKLSILELRQKNAARRAKRAAVEGLKRQAELDEELADWSRKHGYDEALSPTQELINEIK